MLSCSRAPRRLFVSPQAGLFRACLQQPLLVWGGVVTDIDKVSHHGDLAGPACGTSSTGDATACVSSAGGRWQRYCRSRPPRSPPCTVPCSCPPHPPGRRPARPARAAMRLQSRRRGGGRAWWRWSRLQCGSAPVDPVAARGGQGARRAGGGVARARCRRACMCGMRCPAVRRRSAQPLLYPSRRTSTSNSATFCTPVRCSVRRTCAGSFDSSSWTVGPDCDSGRKKGEPEPEGVGRSLGQRPALAAPRRRCASPRALSGGAASTRSHRESSRS